MLKELEIVDKIRECFEGGTPGRAYVLSENQNVTIPGTLILEIYTLLRHRGVYPHNIVTTDKELLEIKMAQIKEIMERA